MTRVLACDLQVSDQDLGSSTGTDLVTGQDEETKKTVVNVKTLVDRDTFVYGDYIMERITFLGNMYKI